MICLLLRSFLFSPLPLGNGHAAGALTRPARSDDAAAAEICGPYFLNNTACLHHRLGRHHAGAFYASSALRRKPADAAISLNTGLELLLAGQPRLAFGHLLSATPSWPENASLWLRLAEACVSCAESAPADAAAAGSSAAPTPSLPFAVRCLDTALDLLHRRGTQEGELLCAVGCCRAYASLRMQQPQLAIVHARGVLQDASATPLLRCVGARRRAR